MSAVQLITLAEAKAHLRVDTNADDAQITAYTAAASSAIGTYIGAGVYEDEAKTIIRDDVKTACKLLVGDFYRMRESESPDRVEAGFGYGYLPAYVVGLLFPYRMPSVG